MNTSAYMTLGAAAKATDKSKTTISKYIKNGKLSIISKDDSGYQIDPAELFRVFTPNDSNSNSKYGQSITPKVTGGNTTNNSALTAEIEIMKVRLSAEKARADNLEQERNDWKEQAQKLLLQAPNKLQERPKSIFGWIRTNK